jgi:hypothetical protein
MDSDRARGRRYRLVLRILRGELGEPFGYLFEGMQMDRVAGTIVLTGRVIDQAHLHGSSSGPRNWAWSSSPSSRRTRGPMRPDARQAGRAESRGAAEWNGKWNGELVRMTRPKDKIVALTLLSAAAGRRPADSGLSGRSLDQQAAGHRVLLLGQPRLGQDWLPPR